MCACGVTGYLVNGREADYAQYISNLLYKSIAGNCKKSLALTNFAIIRFKIIGLNGLRLFANISCLFTILIPLD